MNNQKNIILKENEEKEISNNRYANHPRGRAISLMEMYHIMLKYPEVYTNILFQNVSTLSLELCDGIKRNIKKSVVTVVDNPEDSAHIGTLINRIQKEK